MIENDSIFFEPFSEDPLPTFPLLDDAREFILKFYNEKTDGRFVFHNYNRTEKILDIAHRLGKSEKLSETEMCNLLLAACFCETQKLDDSSTPVEIWKSFLKEWEYPEDQQPVVPTLIDHYLNPEKQPKLANLLRDAVVAATFSDEFEKTLPLQRLELELIQNKKFTNLEWNREVYNNLLQANYRTPAAKQHYGSLLAKYILEVRNKIQKLEKKAMNGAGNGSYQNLFEGLEKKNQNSAIQTLFRTNYRNHINLSAIADTKANIMISVNAILISVVISILSYQQLPETKPIVLLPVVIFLVTGLTSLIFAVLSIRPKVTMLNEETQDLLKARKNILFFGNFVSLSLEEYEQAMDAVLRDGQLIYGNMVRDTYFLGKVLDKKYKHLTLSYNIFMLGFVATVLTFLVVLFS